MEWEKNKINRLKRRFLQLLTSSPHPLTSPLPRHLPKFWPSGAWGPGETGKPRWRLMMAPMFNFKWKHGFCQNAAWSFSSAAYYFLDHSTVIKGRYFILNKKTQVCLQTVTKHMISCTAWRILITVPVRYNGFSLQSNFRANETT